MSVWNLVSGDLSVVVDGASDYFGEVAVHFVAALASSFATQAYYENQQQQ